MHPGSWSKTSQPGSPVSTGSTSPKSASHPVTFEIVSAKTVSQGRKKYVCYTVLVKKNLGLERLPGVLERRYSDFLALYLNLKKQYPSLLQDFPFPKKALIGNFTAEVITERSLAFRQFLSYTNAVRELRQSPEFAEFMYNREVREAHKLMLAGQFEDASVILENAYFVQEKILGDSDFVSFTTLCILVACLNAVDNVIEAQKYAEIALKQLYPFESCELAVPLLVLSIRLWWAVGKDKRDLEDKLQEIKRKGTNVDKLPTLLELVLKKDTPFFSRA